jgi:hypothetical protein
MILPLVLLFAMTSAASDLRVLYDARLSPQPAAPSAAEAALLESTARPAARQAFQKLEGCADEFTVVDVAAGSFTRSQARQKAILYRYCTTGHGFAADGLAVIEDGRVVAHVTYEGGWDSALGSLPDLDGDGLSEILIASGGTNQGITTTSVGVIGVASGVKKFGRFQVYEDNCGSGAGPSRQSASKLLARPGKSPAFFREDFTNISCEGNSWRKKGSLKPAAPEADSIEYRTLKVP